MATRRRPSGGPTSAERTEEYYRKVAEALIEQIERGTAPWTQGWTAGESQRRLPANVKTGKAYRGGNSVWLASVAERSGYGDHRWGTFKQVKEVGGQVCRGERGSQILYWDWEKRRAARDRNGKPVLDEKGQPVYETRRREVPFVYQLHGVQRRAVRRAAGALGGREAAELEPGRGGRASAAGHGSPDHARRPGQGVLRPAPRPHHAAVPGAVPELADVLPGGTARGGALDGAPGPAEQGYPAGRHRGGSVLEAVRQRGNCGRKSAR